MELRQLHEETDRAVLAAYGWQDIGVPPYTAPTTAIERKALERFEDEVIDRLFILNTNRSTEERVGGARLNGRTKRGKNNVHTLTLLPALFDDVL